MTRCYLAFAGFAATLGLLSGQPIERCWGIWAASGYTAAAAIVALAHRRDLPGSATTSAADAQGGGAANAHGSGAANAVAHAAALAFATFAPLAWQAWAGLPSQVGEGSLTVVARAGGRLLRHGTPYLPASGLSHVLAYDPYEPLMAMFGLPHAAGLAGWAGDPRLWLTLIGTAVMYLTFRISGARAPRNTAFALASPVISLQVATGGTDLPVIALLCLSLAAAATAPDTSAIATGIACALKATAWPAVPVLAAMLAARSTARTGWRFAAMAAMTAVTAMAAAAPAAPGDPAAAVQNAVMFPLGLTRHRTPAASALPGHLLAATGPAGRWATFALLGAMALAFAWWLARRPPRDAHGAAGRLAVGLAAVFTLAPAARWGYFAYPLALAGWRYLATPPGRQITPGGAVLAAAPPGARWSLPDTRSLPPAVLAAVRSRRPMVPGGGLFTTAGPFPH